MPSGLSEVLHADAGPATRRPGIAEAVDARILAAQARRDRARLVAATAEITDLRRQVVALARRPGLRLEDAARRAFLTLPGPLRAAVLHALGRHPAPPALPDLPPRRGIALVVDDHWPQPDRDAGSVEIANLLHALVALGFHVHFVAAREPEAAAAARAALTRAGIEAWATGTADTDAAGPTEALLARLGPVVDLCVLCRVYCGGRFLDAARRHLGKARIVFNSVDLHFVREERRARLHGDAALLEAAGAVRAREQELIRASDATVVVSRAELDLLAGLVPEAYVVELPLARPLSPPRTPFTARRGVGFIGNFAHVPNVDAVRHFLDAVWPQVLRNLPDAELDIVGAGIPADLLAGSPPGVRALGHVPDVGPWFESLRLTVAPLRFGAGAKGKVASSLAAGVPCVVTPVAAEGMGLEGAGVVVAADPDAFATAIRAVHEDPVLWARLSAEGLAHARVALSEDAWRGRLDTMLGRLGLLGPTTAAAAGE